jgi:hypothetical protein
MLIIDWKSVLEISFSVIFILALIIVSSFFILRSLHASYKEVYKYQSKFDIELRKTLNLLSKVIADDQIETYMNLNIKELTSIEKKKIIQFIDGLYHQIDITLIENQYLVETYENLQEVRRTRDSLALIFNQKILMFPFNLAAKIVKLEKWDIYTEK